MKTSLLVIGGGLSGLAAAIRSSRFIPDVLLIEKHSRFGGLNSYFYRNSVLYETGLHAITNFASPKDKKAPLNRLLRQLKIKRENFSFCEQLESKILFENHATLRFSNDINLLQAEISSQFPESIDQFNSLLAFLAEFDPFFPTPFRSTRQFLSEKLQDPLLIDMLLCPLMYYGSSVENDMDLSQFAIMFQAIFLEGFFRPEGTIKDFLDLLINHLDTLGGTTRLKCSVEKIVFQNDTALGVLLDTGEFIECDNIISTIGFEETKHLIEKRQEPSSFQSDRLCFIENIYRVQNTPTTTVPDDATVIFFNKQPSFSYQQPAEFLDLNSGVICFPQNFQSFTRQKYFEVRSTHLANYSKWRNIYKNLEEYQKKKNIWSNNSLNVIENIIGRFSQDIVYENTFTPVTIERYTSKIGGAIYGSPTKIKDGNIGYKNVFLAGTDQGFLGIIGSMLSGVSIVNQCVLSKL